ncbi:MAG: FAD-binding protein [Edafosvirus sp.]|uniref:FAD-binding protein n=1 Tax=Edafosvirus sp. TaxID=2487765 RepID=A0A3G4ZSS6_9VIRU|nr:MAG: FAD-binding protein [Edafosvirus sp.]
MKESYDYQNFNKLYKATASKYYEPKSLYELKNHIKENNKVRVFGSVHAFNDISLPAGSGALIKTNNLDKVLEINKKNNTVKIESGVILYKLLDELAVHNLTIPSVTATSYVSVVGAISTGAHGSNSKLGSMANLVISAEIVKADGTLLEINENMEEMKAIRCSLGCIGAIYSVTLQCENMFGILEEKKVFKWNDFYNNMDTLLEKYDYLQATIDPFDDQMNTHVELKQKVKLDSKTKGYKNLTSKYNEYYIEIELAFAYELADKALRSIIKYHRFYYKKYGIKSDSTILIRFSGSDNSFISMCSDRKTIYISTFFGKGIEPEKVYKFMKKLCNKMIKLYNARPHYGKINDLNKNQMEQIYGSNYKNFQIIKNKLDPTNKFSNDYINRIFN